MGNIQMDVMLVLYLNSKAEGSIVVADEFSQLDGVQQADLLQDWMDHLEDMYESVLDGTFQKELKSQQPDTRKLH